MKKSQIIKMVEPFDDDDELSFDGEVHIFGPVEKVCGKSDSLMGYVCCLKPGHEGQCYTRNKNLEFDPIEE